MRENENINNELNKIKLELNCLKEINEKQKNMRKIKNLKI